MVRKLAERKRDMKATTAASNISKTNRKSSVQKRSKPVYIAANLPGDVYQRSLGDLPEGQTEEGAEGIDSPKLVRVRRMPSRLDHTSKIFHTLSLSLRYRAIGPCVN